MKISMDKKYRTQGGLEVRILCTDLQDEPSVCGAIHCGKFDLIERWAADGQYSKNNASTFDLLEVSPFADFKKDEPVMVRHHEHDYWKRRYFSHEKSGMAFAFDLGATSWSSSGRNTTLWQECRHPTPEELNA